MKRSTNNHTTVILLLSNGTHRSSQWYRDATSHEVWKFTREVHRDLSFLNDGVYINEMFLACGVQSLRYTRNEVIELCEKVS